LKLPSDVVDDVVEFMLGTELDVLAVVITPCSVPRRRAPHIAHMRDLFAAVFVAEV